MGRELLVELVVLGLMFGWAVVLSVKGRKEMADDDVVLSADAVPGGGMDHGEDGEVVGGAVGERGDAGGAAGGLRGVDDEDRGAAAAERG
jgi:hypothetical protein